MHSIGDEFHRHPGVFEKREHRSWAALAHVRHAVEQVRRDSGARVDGRHRGVVIAVRVTYGRDGARLDDLRDGVKGTRKLRGESDHAHDARVQQVGDLTPIRCPQLSCVVSSALMCAEPRAFEVDPGDRLLTHQRLHLVAQCCPVGRHKAGNKGGGAVSEV
jgi:hypothetical protein